jgi:hypothetical protein
MSLILVFLMSGPVDFTCYFPFGEPQRYTHTGYSGQKFVIKVPQPSRCEFRHGTVVSVHLESQP